MQTGNKLFIGMLVVIVGFIVFSALTLKPQSKVGSVSISGEYQGTTTYNGAGAPNLQKDTVLKSSNGTLGTVTITGAVAGVMTFYDATSSDPTLTTSRASTTLAIFPASTAAGTYVFDRIASYGILVSFSSATALPTSTITTR